MKIKFKKLVTPNKKIKVTIGDNEPKEYNVVDVKAKGIDIVKGDYDLSDISITTDTLENPVTPEVPAYIEDFYDHLSTDSGYLMSDCRLSQFICDKYNVSNPLNTDPVPGNYYIDDIEDYKTTRLTKGKVTFKYADADDMDDYTMFKSDAEYLTNWENNTLINPTDGNPFDSIEDMAKYWTYSSVSSDLPECVYNGEGYIVDFEINNEYKYASDGPRSLQNYSSYELNHFWGDSWYWLNSFCNHTNTISTDEEVSNFKGYISSYGCTVPMLSPEFTKTVNLEFSNNSSIKNVSLGAIEKVLSDVENINISWENNEMNTIDSNGTYYMDWWYSSSNDNVSVPLSEKFFNAKGKITFKNIDISSLVYSSSDGDYTSKLKDLNISSESSNVGVNFCKLSVDQVKAVADAMPDGMTLSLGLWNNWLKSDKILDLIKNVSFTNDNDWLKISYDGLDLNDKISYDYWTRSYWCFSEVRDELPTQGYWELSWCDDSSWWNNSVNNIFYKDIYLDWAGYSTSDCWSWNDTYWEYSTSSIETKPVDFVNFIVDMSKDPEKKVIAESLLHKFCDISNLDSELPEGEIAYDEG